MSRIDDIFARCKRMNRAALMPFLTGGYPTLDVTRETLPALAAVGADIVEIGFPFSDPIADGPVIAASMHEALEQGTTPHMLFDLVGEVRSMISCGVIAMVSQSIVERLGVAWFVDAAHASGFDGLIVPDVDTGGGEAGPAQRLSAFTRERGMSCSFLIAPTTPRERIIVLTSMSHGFVYLLARAGITGEREELPEIASRVQEVRAVTDVPIAVGFGISNQAHVRAVAACADAAIVGSALVRRMGEADDPVRAACAFVADLSTGVHREHASLEEDVVHDG